MLPASTAKFTVNAPVMSPLREIVNWPSVPGAPSIAFPVAAMLTTAPTVMFFTPEVRLRPRAKILKEHAHDVLNELGSSPRLLEIALELEERALEDDYFVSRRLYPNVDFYSGIIYEALGIPANGFTPFFALGRMPGWLAHWREHHADPNAKLSRPRQIYIGETERNYVPMADRGVSAV